MSTTRRGSGEGSMFLEGLLASMATAGRSRSSVNRVKVYLGQALAVAERRGKVARNVARIAEMPATKAGTERRSMTQKQAQSLLEAARGDRLEALYTVGLTMGLRPGELCGLRWVDLDLDASRLVIEGSMKNERGGLRLGETKTKRSRRSLTMPTPVVVALRSHRKRQLEDRMKVGSAWHDNDLVFCTQVGTPINPANLRRGFNAVAARAGLGHWRLNELRHSAASLLSAAGLPMEKIADILGHTSTRMLEAHYRHSLKPAEDAHVEVMNQMFG